MFRSLPSLAALTVVISLTACDASEIDAFEADFSVGDQCHTTLAQRPHDCFELAPCMWSDADLRIREDEDGVFHVEAGSGGWDNRSQDGERTARASAASPAALARQLPVLLAALHDTPPSVSQACVYLNPDLDMQVGDILAFNSALTAQHVRRVGLFAVLADYE